MVYHQLNKAESIAWGLFKDGMRSLTIRRGAEVEELPRFLETINRARFLPADAGDDLLTLLWEQEFEFIQYQFIEFFGDGGGCRSRPGPTPAAAGDEPRPRARGAPPAAEEAPPRPKGVVDLEEFDSTLYFLDEREINQVAAGRRGGIQPRRAAAGAQRPVRPVRAPGREADPRARSSACSRRCSPIFSMPATSGRRPRCCASAGAGAAARRGSRPRMRARLDGFVAKLSEPAIVSQLVQSLDEAPALGGRGDGRRGAAGASRDGAGAGPDLDPELLASPPLRERARGGGGPAGRGPPRRGDAHPALARVRGARGGGRALRAASAHAGGARPGRDVGHAIPPSGWPRCRRSRSSARRRRSRFIEQALEDGDRAVRLAAVRAVGARGYKGAQRRVEGVVLGQAGEGDGPHREDGVLRGVRRDRGRRRLKPLGAMLVPADSSGASSPPRPARARPRTAREVRYFALELFRR